MVDSKFPIIAAKPDPNLPYPARDEQNALFSLKTPVLTHPEGVNLPGSGFIRPGGETPGKPRFTRLKSIRIKCFECSERRIDIKDCEFDGKLEELCPVWLWRLGHRVKGMNPKAAIKKYCLWCMNDQYGEVLECRHSDCPFWCYRFSKVGRLPQ